MPLNHFHFPSIVHRKKRKKEKTLKTSDEKERRTALFESRRTIYAVGKHKHAELKISINSFL